MIIINKFPLKCNLEMVAVSCALLMSWLFSSFSRYRVISFKLIWMFRFQYTHTTTVLKPLAKQLKVSTVQVSYSTNRRCNMNSEIATVNSSEQTPSLTDVAIVYFPRLYSILDTFLSDPCVTSIGYSRHKSSNASVNLLGFIYLLICISVGIWLSITSLDHSSVHWYIKCFSVTRIVSASALSYYKSFTL